LESAKESDDKNINFAALSEINSETIGWLSACGDYIDGPIVQTDNNDYYLTHLFDKSKGSAGCFFADTCSRPVFECPLTIIYGHYRKDKSMFYPLHYYKDADYYLENPSFFIYTKEGKKEYHIFSVFYGDYEEDFEELYGYGINSSDSTEDKIKNIFDRAAGKSIYNILSMQPGSEMAENMQLSIGEKNADIVVLYTCEYSGTNNRMFVFGINCD
jgi:sortase B